MSKVPVDKKENFSNTSFKRLNIGMIVSYYVNFKANFGLVKFSFTILKVWLLSGHHAWKLTQ